MLTASTTVAGLGWRRGPRARACRVFGTMGFEGHSQGYAGAGGNHSQIAYSAYTYDPQGTLVQRMDPVDADINDLSGTPTTGTYSPVIMDTVAYDAWGGLLVDVDANTGGNEQWQDPIGWGGQWGYYNEAETGLVLLGHRYYDPYRARFLTRDPAGYGAGPNLYAFCGGDPVNNIDPDGTQEAPTDSMAYIGNMFNNLTPHDWLHALKHNDVTRAVVAMANIASYYPIFVEFRAAGVVGEVALKVNCFVAGTLVQMADGTTEPIEQVRAGNWVVSRDEDTGMTEVKQVSAISQRQAAQVLTLALADCRTGRVVQTLTCTPGHPLYVVGQGFVLAGQLAVGNAIATRAGPALIVQSIEWCHNGDGTPRGAEVYNFTVEGDHTYFVGTYGGGAWVHNNSITEAAMQIPDLSKEIALGLDPYYKSLASTIGAAKYDEWVGRIINQPGSRSFGRLFHQAANRASRIHFTLDGIGDIQKAVQRGKQGFSSGNFTNAELHYIMTNPKIRAKTIFYLSGKTVHL